MFLRTDPGSVLKKKKKPFEVFCYMPNLGVKSGSRYLGDQSKNFGIEITMKKLRVIILKK